LPVNGLQSFGELGVGKPRECAASDDTVVQTMAQHFDHHHFAEPVEQSLPPASVTESLVKHERQNFMDSSHLIKLDQDRVGQRVGDRIAAATSQQYRRADHIGTLSLVGDQPMGLRSWQKNQRRPVHHDCRPARLGELNRTGFNQVQMPTPLIAFKVMQAAYVPGVEDARAQRELGQQMI